MAKSKDKKEQTPKKPLTEWQERNIAFLKRKREKEAEQRRQEQEARDAAKGILKALENPEEVVEEPEKKVKVKKQAAIPTKETLKALPILLLALLGILVSAFMLTPYSTDKKISVLGQVNADATSLAEATQIKPSDYISSVWWHKNRYARNVVKANDWVKSATMTYQFPNTFLLKVEEYPIVAYTDTEDGYRPILENGKRPVTEAVSQLPDNYIAINLADEAKIQSIISQLADVKKSIVSKIVSIDPIDNAATKDLLLLMMKDGHQVRVPLSQLSRKLPYYSQVLPNLTEPSIVDMEVGIYTTTDYLEAVLSQQRLAKTEQTPLPESEGEQGVEENNAY